jgi:hypothetical protein
VEIDEQLLKVVAVALTRGQGAFTLEELAAAYDEVLANRIAGTFVELLLEGQLVLRVSEAGEVKYVGLALAEQMNNDEKEFSDAEIAAAVEAFISSARPPEDRAG